MSKEDGGQAFPTGDRINGGHDGMSLRDWFAGQALPAMVEAAVNGDRETNGELISRLAYEMADAMLKERSK